jgi:hypothetical protein
MKIKISSLLVLLIPCLAVFAQTGSLPAHMFSTLTDSTTSMDVVLLIGEGGSISAEGPNVKFFNSFIDKETAAKTNARPAGTIMWLINGREFISGNYFLGDSTGYFVFQKDGKEYVNRMNTQGNSFFKSQIKN